MKNEFFIVDIYIKICGVILWWEFDGVGMWKNDMDEWMK